MPKYFSGDKILPDSRIRVEFDQIDSQNFLNLIQDMPDDFLISVILPGLDEESLGYVFFVRKVNNDFELKDITEQAFFASLGINKLIRVIKHASGISYDHEIQKDFHKRRNELGIIE